MAISDEIANEGIPYRKRAYVHRELGEKDAADFEATLQRNRALVRYLTGEQ